MADVTVTGIFGKITKLFRDMGDTTHAEVVASSAERRSVSVVATFAAGAAVSGAIDVRQFAAGLIHMPAAWDAADIGYKVSPTGAAGSWKPLYASDGVTLVTTSVGIDTSYLLPSGLAAARYVQLWSQNAGVDVVQAAGAAITVDLKS